MTKIGKTCGQMSDLIKCSSFSDFPNKIEHYFPRYDMFFEYFNCRFRRKPSLRERVKFKYVAMFMVTCTLILVHFICVFTKQRYNVSEKTTNWSFYFYQFNISFFVLLIWYRLHGEGRFKTNLPEAPLETDKIIMFTYR